MSVGLGHGKPLDPALGVVGISREERPELPDSIIDDPDSGRLDIREWFEHPDRRFELEIGSGDVTELELMALWLALDLDRSGFLDAQDFGAFMKKGRK